MAFVVTFKNTFSEVPPIFSTWCSDILDPNIVYNKFPEFTGQSISSIVESQENTNVKVPSQGFIGEENYVSDDNLVYTLIRTWESQQDFLNSQIQQMTEWLPGTISTSNNSVTVTGTNTYFLSNCKVGQTLSIKNDADLKTNPGIGKISSIESDTSLTLESATIYAINDRQFNIRYEKYSAVVPFIAQLYNEAYPCTTEITYANV